ncbi:MAG: type II toxin-antitoxin system RelE/ParE family toxin [Leptolyngbyaceae cyanobacterium]
MGSSRADVASFPQEARRKSGFQLRAVQRGLKPTDFKPMVAVGKGVEEIRIWTKSR